MVGDRNHEVYTALKHRITIEEPDTSADGAGGLTTSWSDVDTVWARLESVHSRSVNIERLVSEQLTPRQMVICTIRYRADVTTDMRVSYDSRVFNIRSVTNIDEADIWLEMILEENAAT